MRFSFALVRRSLLAGLALYWMVLVVATHVPNSELPQALNVQDKAIHLVAYGILAMLLYCAWQLTHPTPLRTCIPVIIVVLAGHAALDEITQGFFGRQPDVMDWYADLLGIALALPFAEQLSRYARRLRPLPSTVPEFARRPVVGQTRGWLGRGD